MLGLVVALPREQQREELLRGGAEVRRELLLLDELEGAVHVRVRGREASLRLAHQTALQKRISSEYKYHTSAQEVQ